MTSEHNLHFILAPLLTDTKIGLELTALIADVIAADARFNAWMATQGKRTLSESAMMNAIEAYENATLNCQAAIKHFTSSRDGKALDGVLYETLQVLHKCRSQ